jgi:hypothetical protein
MNRIILLVIIASATWIGWAWAREQEMLNHPADIHMEEMQDASCPPSSNPSGGG